MIDQHYRKPTNSVIIISECFDNETLKINRSDASGSIFNSAIDKRKQFQSIERYFLDLLEVRG